MNRVKTIILGTGQATKHFIIKNQDNEYINIIGIILDEAVCEEDRLEFIQDLNKTLNKEIDVLELSEENLRKADIIFCPEYRKIIPNKYADKFLIVNCHGGILPKWRGYAANAWALMNGEKEIGYSIHRVTSELDGGNIYFVKHIPIEESQTYGDVHDEFINSIANEVPYVLYDIVRNNKSGISQNNVGVAYCTKFNAKMGELNDFSKNSQYYVNLYRCMAKPLGTGLYFFYKDKKYQVGKVEHGKKYNSIDYICTEGKIVNVVNDMVWVKTKDNVIVLSKIIDSETEIKIENTRSIFKNGTFIG